MIDFAEIDHHGLKIDDGGYVWLHHNTFKQIESDTGVARPVFRTGSEITDRSPRRIPFYANRLTDNHPGGHYLINVRQTHDFYLIDNEYSNNDGEVGARNGGVFGDAAMSYICEGTDEADPPPGGFDDISGIDSTLSASSAPCQLVDIGTIFNGAGSSAEIGSGAVFSKKADSDETPVTFALEQNYPNPFNPQTTIKYSLADAAQVRIEVFNVIGQSVGLLVDATQDKGFHSLTWRAGDKYASGIYLYRMTAESDGGALLFTKTSRMLLIK